MGNWYHRPLDERQREHSITAVIFWSKMHNLGLIMANIGQTQLVGEPV